MITLKKLFIAPVFAIALFSTQSIVAQTTTTDDSSSMNNREELNFGIKAGINYSNIYSEEGDGFVGDGKVGFAGGVFVSIPLSSLIGIQPELLYSQKGFESEIFGADFKATFNYLDLPVLLQIKPTEQISILAGPQFSYLMSSKYELEGLGSAEQDELEDDNNRTTLGLTAGVDFNVQNFLISARGSWDLSKVNKDNSTSDINYKNQLFQITLGYKF